MIPDWSDFWLILAVGLIVAASFIWAASQGITCG